MNYKLISIDLDDTLLNDSLEISEENLKAITYAHNKGIKVVICTGRAINSVRQLLDKIGIFNKEDYFISFNGAVISSVQGNIIFKKEITSPFIAQLVEFGKVEGVDIQLYSEDQLYVDKYTKGIEQYEILSGTKAELVHDLKNLNTTLKVLYNSYDIDKLERIKGKICSKLQKDLNVFYSKVNYLEVLIADANKGLALEYLASYLGISKEEVIAIGDSENDIFMIKYAGLGVCMKNGRDSVKQISQYVTSKDNNENGVAEVIYRFIT